MGFRDFDFRPAYDSDEDDVLNEFYIPALSRSIRYRRLAGLKAKISVFKAEEG